MATNAIRNVTDDDLIRMELISKYKREEDWKNQLATIRLEERREGMEKGMKKGMEKGMERGREEREIEIARNSLKKGLDMCMISEITGLTIEEIKKLREQI
ncbi:MAG: hypothetical protein LBJ93_01395 [Clostridiales bacterium]|nr:hypothetical protein [Clostridiales bacterium]